MFWVDAAYAMGAPAGGAEGGAAGAFSAFVPLILMFAIFYFLLIRPQQKKAKDHKELLSNLQKGDRVLTNGGIYGRIMAVDGDKLSVEISDNVQIEINRGYISGKLDVGAGKEKKDKKK